MENPQGGLPSLLQFRPPIWWDPVPWPWLTEMLDKRKLVEVSRIQLQLHRDMLQAQLRAAEQMDKVLAGK
jgi:hypothetical protein